MKLSSTNLNHILGFHCDVFVVVSLKYSIYIFTITRDNGNPIGKLFPVSICWNPKGGMLFAGRMSTSPSGYVLDSWSSSREGSDSILFWTVNRVL